MSPDPLVPDITYGEFPFRLEYEIDGERVIVEDTVICEYDGVGMNEGVGKYRKWKQYLASNHDEEDVLLKVEGDKEIWYSVGGADYYMGDAERYEHLTEDEYHQFPNAYYSEPNSVGGTDSGGVDADELLEKYGVILISWKPSPKITNTFSEK